MLNTKKILALTIMLIGFSTINIEYSYADDKEIVKNAVIKIKAPSSN
jgi:hypothetical protein